MRIYIDATEPGAFFLSVRRSAEMIGIPVERTLLHKREGSGSTLRAKHPLYGRGADVVICDDACVPVAAIERKTMDDIARAFSAGKGTDSKRLFRQMADLRASPTPILLLEGTSSLLYRQLEGPILGFQFWLAREGIALVHSSSLASSARAVCIMARKLAAEYDMPRGLTVPGWAEPEAVAEHVDADEQ